MERLLTYAHLHTVVEAVPERMPQLCMCQNLGLLLLGVFVVTHPLASCFLPACCSFKNYLYSEWAHQRAYKIHVRRLLVWAQAAVA